MKTTAPVILLVFSCLLDTVIVCSSNASSSKVSIDKPKFKTNLDKFSDILPPSVEARYAINFIPDPGRSTTIGDMAATAIVDMMSQIKDPFKHGVTSAVLAGLYITALISLIVFSITGTIAFICSFTDCRNFFLGMKPEGSPRPFYGNSFWPGPFGLRKRDYNYQFDEVQPVVQTVHESLDKYDFGSKQIKK